MKRSMGRFYYLSLHLYDFKFIVLSVTLKIFQKEMLFWSICFLGVGLFFVIRPDMTLRLLGLPLNSEYFWVALAGSMMMTISYLSYEGSKFPLNHSAIRGVLIAKISSSIFFMGALFRTENLLYGLGAAIDFPIFFIILLSYFKVRRLDSRSSRE